MRTDTHKTFFVIFYFKCVLITHFLFAWLVTNQRTPLFHKRANRSCAYKQYFLFVYIFLRNVCNESDIHQYSPTRIHFSWPERYRKLPKIVSLNLTSFRIDLLRFTCIPAFLFSQYDFILSRILFFLLFTHTSIHGSFFTGNPYFVVCSWQHLCV